MLIRKIIGFIVGFIGAFALLAAISSGMGVVPKGAGWLILLIGCGLLMSKLISNPRFYGNYVTSLTKEKTVGAREYWWNLNSKARVVILVSCAWMFLAYFLQDAYERNLKIVVLPAIVFVCLYLAINYLARNKSQ